MIRISNEQIMEKAKFQFRNGLITGKIVNKKYYSKRKRFFRQILE